MRGLNRPKTHWILGGLAILALLVGSGLWLQNRTRSEVQYFTSVAEKGSIRTVVNATGTIQPSVAVQVGSQTSGQIQALYADFNSVVKRGQLLARIDPRNPEAQVQNTRAAVAAAEARVSSSQAEAKTSDAGVENARANLEAARVARDNANVQYQRALSLSNGGLVSKNDLDTAKLNADSAQAKYEQAQAGIKQAEAQGQASAAQIQVSKAQLGQSQADFSRARVDLGYTNIYSPVDGVVISRNVDVGQTIAASLQSPTLFTIANDLRRMKLNSNIDEADIGNISSSSQVMFTVDAFPNEMFHGRIEEIRLNPTTVQNVVTYTAVMSIDNPDLTLKPGMTANVTITVDHRDNVLKVANAALRYTPTGSTANTRQTPPQPAAVDEEEAPRPAPETEAPHDVNLAPGQEWDPSAKLRLAAPRRHTLRSGRVWVLGADGKPEQRNVALGITDGSSTEVVSGNLQPGDAVIIADSSQGPTQGQNTNQQRSAVTNPFVIPYAGGGRRGR